MQDKKPEVLTQQFCEDFGYTMLPVGVPIPWPSEIPPDGWLKCNGEAFDTERYPKLALAYPPKASPIISVIVIQKSVNGRYFTDSAPA